MIIEKRPIALVGVDVSESLATSQIRGGKTRGVLLLNPLKKDFLKNINSNSIFSLAESYLKQNTLISFNDLKELLTFLAEEGHIQDPIITRYLISQSHENSGLFDDLVGGLLKTNTIDVKKELKSLPFFRTLNQDVMELFLKNMEVAQVPRNITLCREGTLQRSLFAILKGSASVYKYLGNAQQKKLATLTEGSVFGEVGFFLNQKRTADVVTDEESLIARIKYSEKDFDGLIKAEKLEQLQKRFWMIHALLKSELFKDLPEDCFDALLFGGEFKTIPAKQFIFKENEKGTSFFLVVQGKLDVSIKGRSIRTLKQGDCFGEVALFFNKGVRSASISTQSEVLLMEIQAQNFYKLLCENLMLACRFEELALLRLKGISPH